MHSKMQFKQHKMVISPRFVSSDSGEKVQKVNCLDNANSCNKSTCVNPKETKSMDECASFQVDEALHKK
jgi:hypothetical protein